MEIRAICRQRTVSVTLRKFNLESTMKLINIIIRKSQTFIRVMSNNSFPTNHKACKYVHRDLITRVKSILSRM